jgi:EAL domain-containing protein (putative c-di-GMP-specific phosphodiesterase class I)
VAIRVCGRHPERGLVPPNDFIGVAEETGLIVPLGQRVLREACRQLRAWQDAYPDVVAPVVAVNLSPRQFRHPDLAGDVAAALTETGLPPALLRLEITETVAMDSPEAAIDALRALKALGVSLALDDFGTGYSSLAYLQRLPVDAIKIDRSFFAQGERNHAIIKAVADLGHGLGLEVIAEGLETVEQVIWARGAGFERGQGYYFAPPLSAEEIEGLWATGLRFQLPARAEMVRLVTAT